MKKLRKSILISLGLMPFIMPMDVGASDVADMSDDSVSSAQELPWRKARFDLNVKSGSRTIGSLDALVPFMGNDDFMVYTNLIAKMGTGANNSNGNTFEGNLGLGVRRVNDSETAIYGAYAFFDYLKSVNDNTFQQITVGAERLGMTWDFRVNAYVPMGTKSYTNTDYTNVIIDKHNLIEFYKTKTETATTGGDIEVGRTLGSQKLRGYLAAYSFGKDLTGSRARFEYALNDTFSLNAAVQYDKARGAQYLLGARFTIGGAKAKNSNSIYSRLTTQVVRDVDVVTQQTEVDNSKVEVDKFWMVDADQTGEGDGTVENPFKYLDDAIEHAPDGAIIFVKGKDGSINRLRDHVSLKNGQVLWGGSEALYWDFNRGVPVFSADEGTLIHDGEGVRQTIGGGIDMADNSSIYNFDLVADDAHHDSSGIHVDNKHNVTIGNITIDGFQSGDANNPFSAINVTGDNADVSFDNVTLTNNDIGISIDGGHASFNDINISHSGSYGIKADNASLDANNISIDTSGISGVLANDSNVNGNNLSITHSLSGAGYEQHGGSANFTGSVSVADSATTGIDLSDVDFGANGITVDGSHNGHGINQDGGSFVNGGTLTVTGSSQDGVRFNNVSGQSGDATINNNQGNGYVQHGGNMAFGNLTVNGNAANGVSLLDALFSATDISLDGNLGDRSFYADNSDVTANSISIDNTTNGDGYYQHGGSANFASAINVNNSANDGIKLNNVALHAGSISVDNSSRGHGIDQQGGSLTVDGDVTSQHSGLNGFNITDASATINGSANFSENGVGANQTDRGYGLNAHNSNLVIDQLTTNKNYMDGINLIDSQLTSAAITTNENLANGLSANNSKIITGTLNADKNTFGYGVNLDNTQLTVTDMGSINSNKQGALINNHSELNLENTTINDNAEHGLSIDGESIANVRNLTATGNGTDSIENATSLDDLESAIDIINGEFHATHIIVTGNAGGIELEKGLIAINDDIEHPGQRSQISYNHGYGVYAHNVDASDANTREIRISNADINNNQNIEGIESIVGFGIYAEDVGKTTLVDVAIDTNQGGAIDINNHDFDASLTIIGSEINGNSGGHAINVMGNNLDLNFTDLNISENSGVGILAEAKNNIKLNTNATTVTDNKGEGIKAIAGNDIDIHFANNSSSNGNDYNGIYSKANHNINIDIDNSELSNNTQNGVYAEVSEGDINITAENASHLDNNKFNGVASNANNDTQIIIRDDSSVDGNKQNGVEANSTSGNIDINVLSSSISNNTLDGLFSEADKNVTVYAADSNINGNHENGIESHSETGELAVSLINSHVDNNELDGINLIGGASETAEGDAIRNHIWLENSHIDNNGGRGIYLNQGSKAVADFNFKDSTVIGNSQYGLQITKGTLTGMLENTDIQDNNYLATVKREGDFTNLN